MPSGVNCLYKGIEVGAELVNMAEHARIDASKKSGGPWKPYVMMDIIHTKHSKFLSMIGAEKSMPGGSDRVAAYFKEDVVKAAKAMVEEQKEKYDFDVTQVVTSSGSGYYYAAEATKYWAEAEEVKLVHAIDMGHSMDGKFFEGIEKLRYYPKEEQWYLKIGGGQKAKLSNSEVLTVIHGICKEELYMWNLWKQSTCGSFSKLMYYLLRAKGIYNVRPEWYISMMQPWCFTFNIDNMRTGTLPEEFRHHLYKRLDAATLTGKPFKPIKDTELAKPKDKHLSVEDLEKRLRIQVGDKNKVAAAQFKVSGAGIHVQASGPPINRDYGVVFTLYLDNADQMTKCSPGHLKSLATESKGYSHILFGESEDDGMIYAVFENIESKAKSPHMRSYIAIVDKMPKYMKQWMDSVTKGKEDTVPAE